jgi:hypothetical protein
MNNPTTLCIDFGGTSIKFGVVQNGRIIRHGNVLPTRFLIAVHSLEPLRPWERKSLISNWGGSSV